MNDELSRLYQRICDFSVDDLASRLIFRSHPNMVRAAWVRGRLLEGPPGLDAIG